MALSSSASSNRLSREKSPYLLQHANNPVDWYPWGPEAFAKAKAEDKPILVSIGYSTCHWCHVMEHESYEDPAIAALMNTDLVNIKVDREERPDVDKIYMSAVSAMTGSGGWPLNVFLTPDLKPFFGGTYFPPTARWGQPAWKDVVTQVSDTWKDPESRKKMLASSEQLLDALKQYASVSTEPEQGVAPWLEAGAKALEATFDSTNGGFGPAPKFPMPVYHNFLLRYYARTHQKSALEMSVKTMRAMSDGGIYDQLGGGFARYSTDSRWHVPHFEKMLYDNAQLAVNYLEAYQVTKDPEFARIARETLDYIRRDMTHPDGGFYSAEDADSQAAIDAHEKTEGAFYVWEREEVLAALGNEAGELFCFRYGVRPNGNAAQDPHGEFKNKNILYVAHSTAETATHFKMPSDKAVALLDAAKATLLAARDKRPRPHLDDKILSGWNGLMISAYAKSAQIFNDPSDLKSAERAAEFLHTHLYEKSTKRLYRRWRDGERLIEGTADDYAFVVQGLLDLYQADFNPQWLAWSIELTESQIEQFYDAEKGGFFMTRANAEHLLLRFKEDQDNVEPTASSVATLNLLRLVQITDRADFQAMAEKTLRAFGASMKSTPRALPQMLVALDFNLTEPRHIVIAGTPGAADTLALLKTVNARFIPVKTVLQTDGRQSSDVPEFARAMRPVNGKATAYVCVKHACQQPTTDPQVLDEQLVKATAQSGN